MHSFVRKLITEWRRLELPHDGNLVIAVSGGADSVSLLLAVADLVKRKKLDLNVVVAHFDHGLRGTDSDADAAFVEMLSDGLGVEFVSKKGRIDRRGNLEQNAREARYRFLTQTAKGRGAFAILTGHTVNDQAETFLLNLIRGSGPDGLKAMPAIKNIEESISLIRPLLRWAKREQTEEFCRDSNVEFRLDAMNEDEKFRRVRIRKEIIPLLAEMNPKIVETLAATAGMMSERQKEAVKVHEELSVSKLLDLPADDLTTLLRAWLEQRRGSLRRITREHLAAIARLVNSRKSGREIELPGGERVVKSGGKLRYSAKVPEE